MRLSAAFLFSCAGRSHGFFAFDAAADNDSPENLVAFDPQIVLINEAIKTFDLRTLTELFGRCRKVFARHEVDKRGRNFFNDDNPSAGRIAWLLWGGDEGRAWATDIKNRIGKGGDL